MNECALPGATAIASSLSDPHHGRTTLIGLASMRCHSVRYMNAAYIFIDAGGNGIYRIADIASQLAPYGVCSR